MNHVIMQNRRWGWLRGLPGGPDRRTRHGLRPVVLALEDRRLLASFAVTNTNAVRLRLAGGGDRQCQRQQPGEHHHLPGVDLEHASDDHPGWQCARSERHRRDADDHGPRGGGDDQRRGQERCVPGEPWRHRDPLGPDHHRRDQQLRRRGDN